MTFFVTQPAQSFTRGNVAASRSNTRRPRFANSQAAVLVYRGNAPIPGNEEAWARAASDDENIPGAHSDSFHIRRANMNFCIVVSSIVSKLSAAFMASNKSPST